MKYEKEFETLLKRQSYVSLSGFQDDITFRFNDLDGGFYTINIENKIFLGADKSIKTLDDIVVAINNYSREPLL